MDVGNVLVIGSAGVGKTTLIRAVLGSDATRTKVGRRHQLDVYESPAVPFRVIDAGDVGGSCLAHWTSTHAVQRWSKEIASDDDASNDINVIWFCVEGKSRKLIREEIKSLARATNVWRHVPIVVVITKSYAKLERDENVDLVKQACARRRRLRENLRAVIPVVAATYRLNETTFVAPRGIPELISATNAALPDGVRAASKDITEFAQRRRRSLARGVVAASTAAAVAVAAVPIPISDALLLTPIETNEINQLASLYGIAKGSTSKQLFTAILEVGTVSTAAKALISALKAIPGISLGASVLNAAIAGSIVAGMGEGTMRVFERIAAGEKSLDDTEWVQSFLESHISRSVLEKGTKVLAALAESGSATEQKSALMGLLASAFAAKETKETKKVEAVTAQAS